jgi:hypothetical protein
MKFIGKTTLVSAFLTSVLLLVATTTLLGSASSANGPPLTRAMTPSLALKTLP